MCYKSYFILFPTRVLFPTASCRPYPSGNQKTMMWGGACGPRKSALPHNQTRQVGCWERTEYICTCQHSRWHPGLFWIVFNAVMGPKQNKAISLSEAVKHFNKWELLCHSHMMTRIQILPCVCFRSPWLLFLLFSSLLPPRPSGVHLHDSSPLMPLPLQTHWMWVLLKWHVSSLVVYVCLTSLLLKLSMVI